MARCIRNLKVKLRIWLGANLTQYTLYEWIAQTTHNTKQNKISFLLLLLLSAAAVEVIAFFTIILFRQIDELLFKKVSSCTHTGTHWRQVNL